VRRPTSAFFGETFIRIDAAEEFRRDDVVRSVLDTELETRSRFDMRRS